MNWKRWNEFAKSLNMTLGPTDLVAASSCSAWPPLQRCSSGWSGVGACVGWHPPPRPRKNLLESLGEGWVSQSTAPSAQCLRAVSEGTPGEEAAGGGNWSKDTFHIWLRGWTAVLPLLCTRIIWFFKKIHALAGVAQWIGLRTKGLLVWFPVRAHAWVADQVPVGGVWEATTHWCFSPSLPSPLTKNK